MIEENKKKEQKQKQKGIIKRTEEQKENRGKKKTEKGRKEHSRKCYQILPKTRSIKKTDAKAKDSKEVLDRGI